MDMCNTELWERMPSAFGMLTVLEPVERARVMRADEFRVGWVGLGWVGRRSHDRRETRPWPCDCSQSVSLTRRPQSRSFLERNTIPCSTTVPSAR